MKLPATDEMKDFIQRAVRQLQDGSADPDTLLAALGAHRDRIDAEADRIMRQYDQGTVRTVEDVAQTVDTMVAYCQALHAESMLVALRDNETPLYDLANTEMDKVWANAKAIQGAVGNTDAEAFNAGIKALVDSATTMKRALLSHGSR